MMSNVNVLLPLMLLNHDRQDVRDSCQDDSESDDIDVKQVMEQVVGDDADLTAKMM